MAEPPHDLDPIEESERLARRAAETGDDRFMRAAAVLADDDMREFRRVWRAKAKRQRNDAIRAMADKYFAEHRPWRQAERISGRLNKYFDRRWSRDRHALVDCPPDIMDTLDGAIWSLWTQTGAEILHHRTVYRILSA